MNKPTTIFLLLLALYLVGIAGSSQVYGAAPPHALTTHIAMTEIPGLAVTDGATVSVGVIYDGAGVAFEAYRTLRGNDTEILVRKVSRDGAEIQRAYFDTSGLKGDDIAEVQTGSDIDVYLVGHTIQGVRYYAPAKGRWENIAIPYPAGQAPRGAPGAYMPGVSPPATGLSDTDVQRVADAVATRTAPQFTALNNNLKTQARAAIDEAFAGEHGSYQVWRQLLDTGYRSASDALKDYRTPTPSPTPRP